MRTRLQVVFDANVIVSAILFPSSKPGMSIFRSRRQVLALASRDTISELAAVLSRPKLDRYVNQDMRARLLRVFVSRAEVVEVRSAVAECRDPADNHLLALAIDGEADMIVSGDEDLLELDPFRGVRILRPADFIARLDIGA